MHDLKNRSVRGGVAKMCSQFTNVLLRSGSGMVLSRLLEPKDFGLVAMVMAVVGVLNLFKDFGLSTAAVQRADVTEEQQSALFWVNLLVGCILTGIALGTARIISSVYHERRLVAITAVLASSFLFNAAGVQHWVRLQRQMRFTLMAGIETVAQVLSVAVGIYMAVRGYGYWALVGMTIVSPIAFTSCAWLTTGWVPGRPRSGSGIAGMLRFGGTVTVSGLVGYIAFNCDKLLLGRYWGAEALGIYGRAYQLVSLPSDYLTSTAGSVVESALSRLQHDPHKMRSYFLKAYSLIVSMGVPITIIFLLHADDIVRVMLGSQWSRSAPVFRLLAPLVMAMSLISPLSWLLFSMGKVGRCLKVALILAPLTISAYILAIPYGPNALAFSYSSVMIAWIFPHIALCVRGSMVSLRDAFGVLKAPLVSGIVATPLAISVLAVTHNHLGPISRLVMGTSVFMLIYVPMLTGPMGQKAFYLDIIRELRRSRRPSPAVSQCSVA